MGFRKDITIVNRSIFNLKDYVKFLQKNGLPLEISEEELNKLEQRIFYVSQSER